ncbi:MAG: HAMP domain-containing sensor histidine kinase [Candidatus Pacebacteria bacterium]|nr:HAMP domain-containing sensor histidine kinase [Candidatus Paceibacterota bacterium]
MSFLRSLKVYTWYYPIIITTLVVMGILSTFFVYSKITANTKESFLKNTRTVTAAVGTEKLLKLTGTSADLTNPDYLSLKEQLEKIRDANKDIRFVYFIGYRDDNPFFFVDSEPSTSSDYSPPGQIFDEASQLLRDVVLGKAPASTELNTDRWGTWISALVPIANPTTNKPWALLGMDIQASSYSRNIFLYTAMPAVAVSLVLVLVVIGSIIRKREQQYAKLKSDLVSMASHEIRTPLTGVFWSAESLLKDVSNLSEDQTNSLEMIKNHTKNLLTTINEFLDSAAVEKVGKEDIIKKKITLRPFLDEIIEDSILVVQEKSLKIVFDDSIKSDTSIFGDKNRLRKMFNNLITNAIKYSKNGTSVTMGSIIHMSSSVFWIKDHGIGIPEKDQTQIFKGFYRASNAKELTDNGTGLGLRYAVQIAELHGGRIWCESKENIGSTFFVELPNA